MLLELWESQAEVDTVTRLSPRTPPRQPRPSPPLRPRPATGTAPQALPPTGLQHLELLALPPQDVDLVGLERGHVLFHLDGQLLGVCPVLRQLLRQAKAKAVPSAVLSKTFPREIMTDPQGAAAIALTVLCASRGATSSWPRSNGHAHTGDRHRRVSVTQTA